MVEYTRRTLLRSAGVAAVGALAGCPVGPGDLPEGDIKVGPGGANRFSPAQFTVSVGDTVTWVFADGGHNVSAVPAHSDEVSIPDGADPFASYGVDGNSMSTSSRGSTYEYTFETPGEYTYVCIPHVGLGMIGTVVVEEGTSTPASTVE